MTRRNLLTSMLIVLLGVGMGVLGNPTLQETVTAEASPPAKVTLLDGTAMRWEKLEFVYEWKYSGVTGTVPDRVSPRLWYLVDGRFGIYESGVRSPGDTIQAIYEKKEGGDGTRLAWRRLLVSGEGYTHKVEWNCRGADVACIVVPGAFLEGKDPRKERSAPADILRIRVQGQCVVDGQIKRCSADLVPARSAEIVAGPGFVKEIVFMK